MCWRWSDQAETLVFFVLAMQRLVVLPLRFSRLTSLAVDAGQRIRKVLIKSGALMITKNDAERVDNRLYEQIAFVHPLRLVGVTLADVVAPRVARAMKAAHD